MPAAVVMLRLETLFSSATIAKDGIPTLGAILKATVGQIAFDHVLGWLIPLSLTLLVLRFRRQAVPEEYQVQLEETPAVPAEVGWDEDAQSESSAWELDPFSL
nr:hypothetical protein B0A51_11711 [Rachicladosporium sp. CCFEE 5018]